MSSDESKLIVLAIGGNSLIKDPAHKTVRDQYEAVLETCASIAELVKRGHRVVITHGNGPQVGFILRRSELSSKELHIVPLDSCGADTQGAIGYQLQKGIYNMTREWAEQPQVATVVTQVLVDGNDPGFKNPTKPIGTFLDEATAETRKKENGWHLIEDAGRGFRRVVASPRPLEIIEYAAISKLVEEGFVVVAVGGGGIPVVKDENGDLIGAEAVIDKDLATSLLAGQLKADLLLISTAVEQAYLNFGKDDQKAIDTMTVSEAKAFIEEKHFAPGSMLPKVQAMIEFVEASGGEALITDPPNLMQAVDGATGTRLVP